MQVQKIDEVNFNVNLAVEDKKMALNWRKGQLFLSISSLLIKDDERTYEMPVRDMEYIQVVEDSPPKVRFGFKNYDVTMTSKNIDQLRALRHFLLPFVDSARAAN